MFLNLLILLYPGIGNNKMKFVGVDRIPIRCFPIRWYVAPPIYLWKLGVDVVELEDISILYLPNLNHH